VRDTGRSTGGWSWSVRASVRTALLVRSLIQKSLLVTGSFLVAIGQAGVVSAYNQGGSFTTGVAPAVDFYRVTCFSTTLLTLNLLAFLAHTFLELVGTPYRAIRQKLSARKTFFHDFTTLTKYVFFESWSQLMAFMVEQLEIEPVDTG
jgi:hypothetical protein